MFKLFSKVVFACALFAASNASFALASGSVVFDPTNWASNYISAYNAVKATVDRALQVRTQLMQYEMEAQQLKGLGSGDFSAMNSQNSKDLTNINGFIGSLNKTYGDLNSVQDRMSTRFTEQAASGLSWQEYCQSEAKSSQSGLQSAKDRALVDRTALQKVNDDYEQARVWGQQVSETGGGMERSMELMNQQMNKVITQNAEILKTMALNSLQTQRDNVDDLGHKQKQKDALGARAKEIQDSKARSNSELNSWLPVQPH